MSATFDFDFAILGGGSAGYAAARTAASLGLRTVVIDGASELGGLCILRGCMPSKTLIESANRNLTLRHAADFGLQAVTGAPDIAAIRQRKRVLVEEFASYRQGQLADGRFTLLRGQGKFQKSAAHDSLSLSVALPGGETRELTAATALIATGSEIFTPDVPGLDEAGFWTSDTLLDAAEVPDSFVVLGGGAIALEMAHYLEAIGRRVSIIQRSPHLLTGMDPDLAEVIQDSFERRGMFLACGTRLLRVEQTSEGKRVVYEQDGSERSVEAKEILLALGRRPATRTLDLPAAEVGTSASGQVSVTLTMQTSHPRIFAAGDVCGPLEVVHIAIQQGETAAKNAASLVQGTPLRAGMDYRCNLFGVFTEPQAAVVGAAEFELNRAKTPYVRATYPFSDHGKAMVMGETEGFVKLLAEPKTGKILGGAVVGPKATELIHEIALAMHLGATAADVASAPHYHPTLSEIWTYPAEDIAENTAKNTSA